MVCCPSLTLSSFFAWPPLLPSPLSWIRSIAGGVGGSIAGGINVQGPFVKTPANTRIAAKVSRLVLVGLRLLQRWSCVVLECMAWKYTHPCSQAAFKRAGGDPLGKGMEYERVVRYNWTNNELSAIVEVRVGED